MRIQRTDDFIKWFNKLKDNRAIAKIAVRIERAQTGNLGDVKPVGEGVSEMRISYGSGYRIYFVQRGMELIILLAGGDKSSQSRDIKKAQRLAKILLKERS